MKTTTIITVLLIFHSFSASCQLSFSDYVHAETLGDTSGGGYASDNCSSAEAIATIPMSMTVSASGCGCLTSAEGFPQANLLKELYISNPSNSFPASAYIGHTIPFGFKSNVAMVNFEGDYTADFAYEHSYGSDKVGFLTNNSILLPSGQSNLPFTAEENLILPQGNYYAILNDFLYGTICPDDILTGVSYGNYKILLPSQFYSDNAITAPTTVNISGFTFDVETVCAENMYIENLEVDSYHYGTAGDMFFDAEVVNGSNVSVSAANIITLGPGFYVDASSNFTSIPYVGCTP